MANLRAGANHILNYTNTWTRQEPELKDLVWTPDNRGFCTTISKDQKDTVVTCLNGIPELKYSFEPASANNLTVIMPVASAVTKLQTDELNVSVLGMLVYVNALLQAGLKEKMAKIDPASVDYVLVSFAPHAKLFQSTVRSINPVAQLEEQGFPYVGCRKFVDQALEDQLEKKIGECGFTLKVSGFTRAFSPSPIPELEPTGYQLFRIHSLEKLAHIAKYINNSAERKELTPELTRLGMFPRPIRHVSTPFNKNNCGSSK